jgi:hypothetical protein
MVGLFRLRRRTVRVTAGTTRYQPTNDATANPARNHPARTTVGQ